MTITSLNILQSPACLMSWFFLSMIFNKWLSFKTISNDFNTFSWVRWQKWIEKFWYHYLQCTYCLLLTWSILKHLYHKHHNCIILAYGYEVINFLHESMLQCGTITNILCACCSCISLIKIKIAFIHTIALHILCRSVSLYTSLCLKHSPLAISLNWPYLGRFSCSNWSTSWTVSQDQCAPQSFF